MKQLLQVASLMRGIVTLALTLLVFSAFTPTAWGQSETPATPASAPEATTASEPPAAEPPAAESPDATSATTPEPAATEPAVAVPAQEAPAAPVPAQEPEASVRVASPASPEQMESWKRKWLWTGVGGGAAFLLSFLQANEVKSANEEQKKHIDAINNDPLMTQSEYNSHKSAIVSAESQAKQAKTMADLFFLTSAGLIGTATYFYLHPPTGDSLAAHLSVLPSANGRGVFVAYQ